MTLSTLEVLYAAKARLEGGEQFGFNDWTACTCGHIYAAALGKKATDCEWQNVAYARAPKFKDHILVVARALGWDGEGNAHIATEYVSQTTRELVANNKDGSHDDEVRREHAIAVIDKAISTIEAEHEHNRLDVLAQAAAAVVDNAEPVPAEV